jgi:hypothetical protein
MSWRSRKIALSATVGGALLALGAVATTWNKPAPVSLPPLLQGVKGDALRRTDEPGEFERRLREWFPVGSSEAALVRELLAEGFKPNTAVGAATKTATFQRMNHLSLSGCGGRGGGYCDLARRDASVSWTVDEEGKLTSITGYYWVQVS